MEVNKLTRNEHIGDDLGKARDEQELGADRNGFVEDSTAQPPKQKREDLEGQRETEEELKLERSLLRHGGTLGGEVGRHLEQRLLDRNVKMENSIIDLQVCTGERANRSLYRRSNKRFAHSSGGSGG
jgi:hypothetical protein